MCDADRSLDPQISKIFLRRLLLNIECRVILDLVGKYLLHLNSIFVSKQEFVALVSLLIQILHKVELCGLGLYRGTPVVSSIDTSLLELIQYHLLFLFFYRLLWRGVDMGPIDDKHVTTYYLLKLRVGVSDDATSHPSGSGH